MCPKCGSYCDGTCGNQRVVDDIKKRAFEITDLIEKVMSGYFEK